MWKIGIVALPAGVTAWAVTGQWRAGLLAGILVAALVLALRAAIVAVPARKAAVITNRLNFYTRLRGPGLGLILPFWEQVALHMDVGPKTASMTIRDFHTRDQVPIAISLSFIYHLDPWRMRPELRPQLIHVLEPAASTILQRQVEHMLHRLVGGQAVDTLMRPEVRAFLERSLTDGLTHVVGRLGIAISGQVMLGNIALPEAVQAEINLAQQARILAEARADTLNTLREALGAEPDRALEKAIEVEAVEAAARHGVPIVFPYSAGWGLGGAEDRAARNGKPGEDA